jgi:hypothetical protein
VIRQTIEPTSSTDVEEKDFAARAQTILEGIDCKATALREATQTPFDQECMPAKSAGLTTPT